MTMQGFFLDGTLERLCTPILMRKVVGKSLKALCGDGSKRLHYTGLSTIWHTTVEFLDGSARIRPVFPQFLPANRLASAS